MLSDAMFAAYQGASKGPAWEGTLAPGSSVADLTGLICFDGRGIG